MNSLVPAIRTMLQRRAQLAAELHALDTELSEARGYLAEFEAPASVTVEVSRIARPKRKELAERVDARVGTCERCGKSFAPTPGSSGRFCSTRCYGNQQVTGTPDERRILIIRVLRERGPLFVHDLVESSDLAGISRATMYNDLKVLEQRHSVIRVEQGYKVIASPSVSEDVRDDADAGPFATMN